MDDRRHHRDRTSSASGDVVSSSGQVVLPPGLPSTSEDLHAWSIYRQNLNSDFTDSALGSSEKSPMPYGNFHLRETTMQSIINNPKYGPKSELGTNMFTYLKFGLPRVLPPNRSENLNSSGYDSTDDDLRMQHQQQQAHSRSRLRAARSEDFILDGRDHRDHGRGGGGGGGGRRGRLANGHPNWTTGRQQRNSRLKSSMSEANLLNYDSGGGGLRRGYRSNGHLNTFVNQGLVDELEQDYDDEDDDEDEEEEEDEMEAEMEARRSHRGGRMSKAHSQLSVVSRHSRATHLVDGGVSYRMPEAPMLNDKYFPRDYLGINGYHAGNHNAAPAADHVDGFKYPHLQLRNVSFATKAGDRILEGITMEARGGELMAVMATKRK